MRVLGAGVALGVAGAHPRLDRLFQVKPAVLAVPSLLASPKDPEEGAQSPRDASGAAVETDHGFHHAEEWSVHPPPR